MFTGQSSQNNSFRKTLECPTNELLLNFLNSGGQPSAAWIVAHLETCEFCELSLELMNAHPDQLEPPTIPPVPDALLDIFSSRRQD
jgi:hypothetical protein